MGCTHQGHRVSRHDEVADALAAAFRKLGCSAKSDQPALPMLPEEQSLRADLTVALPGARLQWLDVTIASPTTRSALQAGAASRDGAAAESAEG
eukprot:10095139-Alexandrium_andersonii.AAC.1